VRSSEEAATAPPPGPADPAPAPPGRPPAGDDRTSRDQPGREPPAGDPAPPTARPVTVPAWLRRHRRALAAGAGLGLLYAALAMACALPSVTSWGTRVPGDSGDSLLNLWTMDWVWHNLFHWHALWEGQMFRPNGLTLAYSEGLLPQALLFGTVRAVFATSDALAFDVVLLVSWVAAFAACHRLLRRLGCDTLAAVAGAVAWNLSAARLGQVWHFQLVTAAALVPVVLLLALRLLERPGVLRGLALGTALGASVLAASYYGVMLVLATGFLLVGWLALERGAGVRALVVPLAAGAAVAAVLVLPVWQQYSSLQQDPYFRRSAEPQFATTARDLLVPAGNARVRTATPLFDHLQPANAERQLFPGLVILPFAALGAIALARGRWSRSRTRTRTRPPSRARREATLLVGLGLVMLLLSGGERGWLVGWDEPSPYRALQALVPPLDGVRAPSRFALLFQLAVAVLGAIGLARLGRRLPRRAYAAVGVVVVALVAAESSIRVPSVRVPTRAAWTAVNHDLERRPPGTVAELPMVAAEQGIAWPFVESPRQYLARIDGKPRINGYSGFEPPGFPDEVATLNTFPSTAAIELLGLLDVRYVVVRDGLVGDLDPGTAATVAATLPRLPAGDAAIAALATTRPDAVRAVTRDGDAWLVELTPG
jgi:hypothetical protein